MFAMINAARLYGINPEDALEKSNKKFIRRFSYVEKKAHETERNLSDMTLEEMDEYWNEAKAMEKAWEDSVIVDLITGKFYNHLIGNH